jgi:arylsulfatase A-like enzyme
MTNRPGNVLFITADQWRGDCLSALGHPCLRTPQLDALAREGVIFSRHYAQASPCGPSRASLYTGLYLHNHRSVVNGTPLDSRHTNVALEARKAGYEPALFGYTDVSVDPRQHHPSDPSLRSYEGVLPGMVPVIWMKDTPLQWIAELKSRGYEITPAEVYKPKPDFPGAASRGATFAPARFAAADSATAFLTDEVIKYLSVRQDEPWFVHLSYLSPHPPFIAPEPYHAKYDPADVPLPVRAETPADEAKQHPYLDYYLQHQRGAGLTFGWNAKEHHLHISDRDLRQLRATYYGMISEVDAQIGRLVSFLQDTDCYNNTLIVFTSDHGEMLGDHWQLAKYSYFDQTFRVPLIVRDPRPEAARRGRVVEAFTESVDVMPTIADWLGLEVPSTCDGESLLGLCHSEENIPWRSEAHFALDFRNFADDNEGLILGLKPDQCAFTVLRDEHFKYVHFTALPPLFFDLNEDPMEFNNVAEVPAYQGRMLEYAQKLISWRMNHEDRTLTHVRLTPAGPVTHLDRRW